MVGTVLEQPCPISFILFTIGTQCRPNIVAQAWADGANFPKTSLSQSGLQCCTSLEHKLGTKLSQESNVTWEVVIFSYSHGANVSKLIRSLTNFDMQYLTFRQTNQLDAVFNLM